MSGNHLLSSYHPSNSWVHRQTASHKLLAALFFIALVLMQTTSNWRGLLLIACGLIIIAITAQLHWKPLIRRLLALELLALGIALLPLLQGRGIEQFLFTLSRISLCLFVMIVLSSTTRFHDILQVLWRVGVPPLLISTLALMYRYLFLLQEEMQTLNRARRSRTFSDNRQLIWQTRANLLAQLFIRSSERAERIYGAMKARGWKG